jgi:hypothetical protein
VTSSTSVSIQRCSFAEQWARGILLSNVSEVLVSQCTFERITGQAMSLSNLVNRTSVTENNFKDIGIIPGAGISGK